MVEAKGEGKTFLEHLEELRRTCLKCAIAVIAGATLIFSFVDKIFLFIKRPLIQLAARSGVEITLHTLSPHEAFSATFTIAIFVGLAIAMPLVLFFLWQFISPALYPNERKLVFPFVLCGLLLFIAGISFAYLVVLPICLRFFWTFNLRLGTQPIWTITNYLNFSAVLLIGFGIVFQFPIFAYLLGKLNILSPEILTSKRPYAIVIIFFLAALLTPPEVASQILMAIPMIALYEISILILKLTRRREDEKNT